MASVLPRSPLCLIVSLIFLAVTFASPLAAQPANSANLSLSSISLLRSLPEFRLAPAFVPNGRLWAPNVQRSVLYSQFVNVPSPFAKPPQTNTLSTIDRMEAAFYCNDTPFVDQVRFPLTTLWRGRVKLVGFESDVTTANFVLGLPGGGTLPSLGMFSSGHLVTRTAPSDQLTGIHLTFNLRAGEVDSLDNSGLRGIQYVMRASRNFVHSFASW
jgi:hypothetical protein